jgi:hypothetical protein
MSKGVPSHLWGVRNEFELAGVPATDKRMKACNFAGSRIVDGKITDVVTRWHTGYA